MRSNILLKILLSMPFIFLGEALRDVDIEMPVAVAKGDSAVMKCHYDLEGAELYSVKWYKGRTEFFRYVPKELPHIKVFPTLGAYVDISQSGPNTLALRDMQWDLSGKYRCEVSTDAPDFTTIVVASYIQVVDPPLGNSTLITEKNVYTVGETIRGNCTSPPSAPVSNITWLVNGKAMESSYEGVLAAEPRNTSSSSKGDARKTYRKISHVEFTAKNFQSGKLTVICRSDMYKTFVTQAQAVLEEENPKLASILSTLKKSAANQNRISWILLCAGFINTFRL